MKSCKKLARSSDHSFLTLELSFKIIPRKFEVVFWCLEREWCIQIHSNPPILYYTCRFNPFITTGMWVCMKSVGFARLGTVRGNSANSPLPHCVCLAYPIRSPEVTSTALVWCPSCQPPQARSDYSLCFHLQSDHNEKIYYCSSFHTSFITQIK